MNAHLFQIGLPHAATAADRRAALRQALSALDPTLQSILALKFFQHHSTAEIADELHCSVARVQLLQHQALVEVQRLVAARPTQPALHV